MMTTRGGGLSTFLVAGSAAFMASLDNLVVTTALPTIRDRFHTTLENLEWTVNAYTLTFAVLLLTAAILGDRFGRRTVFTVGVAIFTLGSALAALSTSAQMLVLARAIQGVGGSVLFPLALTLVVQAVRSERRGLAIAGLSGMSGLAIALGPWVGGVIVQLGDWHWIFWLNVPIGLVLIPAALAVLRESHGPYTRLDVVGTVLVTGASLGIVYALVRSGRLGWLNPEVLLPLAGGIALGVAFIRWERRVPNPVVPPAMFRRRGFALTSLTALLIQGGMFGAVFLLSQFLQDALHYRPMSAGLRTLPWTFMPVLVAPAAAIFAGRLGVRRLMVVGAALQTVALAWFAVVASPSVGYLVLLPAMIIAGIGMGLFFALNPRQMLDFATVDEEGVASGLNNTLRQVGVVLGIAVLSGIFAGTGGSFRTASTFTTGLRPALWAATAILAAAVAATWLTPAAPAREPVADLDEAPVSSAS
jgi:EmrB/QacA subfamily drug resistance transporter